MSRAASAQSLYLFVIRAQLAKTRPGPELSGSQVRVWVKEVHINTLNGPRGPPQCYHFREI